MDLFATGQFTQVYRGASGPAVECIDRVLLRLLDDPMAAWARQNRVEGELGGAWLIVERCHDADYYVYWRMSGESTIELVLLLRR